ncbi:MAG: DUF4202 domain-containing protein [Cyclobacteriaceae bacterium]|nr:DUF4202 domain-containing protein [Cyclobacteriaceae bacterium]
MPSEKFQQAFDAFDAYNTKDPNQETFEGKDYPKELLYAIRMTEKLKAYSPGAPEYLQLAVRCQHIGRWEIPRSSYPMEKKGYLQWRNQLKVHHAKIAEEILQQCNYDQATIDIVKFLLLKKDLQKNPDTQTLEDVICLVFIEYYLDTFAAQHDDAKVVDILQKTTKKMSRRALEATAEIPVTTRVKRLMEKIPA